MKHIKTFESISSNFPEAYDDLSDIFLEFEDKFKVSIENNVKIFETETDKPKEKLIAGEWFNYAGLGRSLTIDKKRNDPDWIYGVVVKLSKVIKNDISKVNNKKLIARTKHGRYKSRGIVDIPDIPEVVRNDIFQETNVIELMVRKYNLIEKRCPSYLQLLGLKYNIEDNRFFDDEIGGYVGSGKRITFEFAFI